MLQLPVEIFEHILELSLPPPPLAVQVISSSSGVSNHPFASWATWNERSETLRRIACVNWLCARWAQRELWRHIVCRDNLHVEQLLECARLLDGREAGLRRLTETVRLGTYDYGDETSADPPPTVDGSRLDQILRVLQPSSIRHSDGIKELWLSGVDNVDLRDVWPLENLRFLSCVQSQLCTKTATTAYSQSSSPRLPFFRTLLLAELEFDDAAQLSFPNHTFPSLEVLDCQRAADFKRIFDCHPVPFPKLKAIYPPRNLPPDWLAPFDLPRSSSQWTSGPAESSGHPSGRPDSRVDPLVCLCLDDETLEEFPTIGASIPSEVFILMLNFRPDEVDDAHLEAFINSPHLEKLLPARTVPGAGRGHKTRGISSIIPEASDFYSSLEELYPDLADQLNAVLEDRIVLWLDSWVTQEWDDYGGVQSLYFLSTAEVLVKAWEFKWCTMYR